ncbi:MAG: YfhO family protein [Bacteroidota bacterium]
MGNDVTQWRAGSESVIEHIETFDEHPLWASNMFSGMPSAVIHNPSSPPSADSFFKWIGGKAHPLAFFWILLSGAYFFFVIQGIRPFSATVGAILIGLTTYLPIIIEAGHYAKFMAYAFVPWMFVGYYLISRTQRKWLAFFTFALAVTLQLRANHPQITYYFLYLLGFWWMYDSWLAYKKDEIWDWAQRTGIAFGAGILAIICSIDIYWRLYEYSQHSTRSGSTLESAGGGGLSLDYAFSWSQGVGELLTLVIPGLYGGSSGEAYWGPKSFTSGPHYFGAIAFMLALIGFIHYRKKIKYLFFGVGSLTLLFSLGNNLQAFNEFAFNYLPFFDKFRVPETWLIATVFCFSVLAVYGIEAIIDIAKAKEDSLKKLFGPLGIAIALGVLFAMGSNALLSYEKPGEFEQFSEQLAQQNNTSPDNPQVEQGVRNHINSKLKPDRKEMAAGDSWRYLILVLLASGLIVGFVQKKVSRGYFLAGLLLLTAYDMLSVDNRYVDESKMVSDNLEIEQMIQQQQTEADKFVMQNIDAGGGEYPYRVFTLSRNPFNNAIPSYFYPSIGGYTGAKLAHYQDLVDHLLMDDQTGINHAVLDMLNTKYVTSQQQLPFDGYSEVFSQNNQWVYRNDDVLPKAFFVDSVATVDSPQQAVDQMKPSADFNPKATAIVETDGQINFSADTTAEVTIENYKANEITLETSASDDGFLVLSEIYYPDGWHATIDGEPADIHKTNFVLRGLQVPAGDHTIDMTFEPASSIWGLRFAWFGHIVLWISGLAIIGFHFGWIGSSADDEAIDEEDN